MPSPFDTLSLDELKKRLGILQIELYATNRLYYEGDHWQGGAGWIGPMPLSGQEGYNETLDLLQRIFTSRNVIKEVVGRHTAGVIGWEPSWGLTPRRALQEGEDPTAQEQALIDEAGAALTVWWDKRKALSILQQMASTMLMGVRGGLRLFVPPGRLVQLEPDPTQPNAPTTGLISPDLSAALDHLVLEHTTPDVSGLLLDLDTQEECGLVISRDADNNEIIELYYLADPSDPAGPGTPVTAAGATGAPVVSTRATIMRRISGDVETRIEMQLGGRMPFNEAQRPLLITPQVQQGQRALNLALTMTPRLVISGVFTETTMLNAQMPGEWKEVNGIRTEFVRSPYHRGAGVVNWVRGIDYKDEQGRTVISTPQVDHRDPAPVAPATDAKRAHYQDVLEEVDQGHALMSADATPSGKSREVARDDYESTLQTTQTPVEQQGRWLIETPLAMAEWFLGQPGRWTGVLRATFECHLNAGPSSADEQSRNEAQYAANLLSRRTAMERNNVRDVDAELQRLQEEEGSQLDVGTRLGAALTALTAAGLTLVGAGKLLQLDPEQMQILQADEAPPPPTVPPVPGAPGTVPGVPGIVAQ